MQCVRIVNLLVLKLIENLTAKGLKWGTDTFFTTIFTTTQGPINIYHRGGVKNFGGSNNFQGESRGHKWSRIEFKGGGQQKIDSLPIKERGGRHRKL